MNNSENTLGFLVQEIDGWETWEIREYEKLNIWEMSLGDIADCIKAKPRQRCLAYLATINLEERK